MKETVFTKIINKELPAHIVYEDDLVIAFLDHEPINAGHTLIVPKEPYANLDEVDLKTAQRIFGVAQKLYKAIQKTYKPDGITLTQSNGAFNDVDHFHVHIFPRYKGDGFDWVYPKNEPIDLEQESLKLKKAVVES